MIALRADLLDFTAEPDWGPPSMAGVRWRPDHWLLIGDDGRIAGVQPGDQAPGAGCRCEDHRGRLLMPGFIDTHVHSAQLDVIASHGTELLDWLERYTFPCERAYADPALAARGAALFLDALLAHGTTAAVVFPTVHKVSAEALFAAAHERGMRLIAGKVLMDRHAPDGLRDDVDQAERDCVDLIQRWHGRGRSSYAVTVRFAPTSTPGQLAMAGALCGADPSLYMQTHVAENPDEVQWVRQLFPQARSYLDVYASAGLLHARSVLAHGIWIDDADRAQLHERGAQIAFCPSSNLFLGSGLFDWPAARAAGVQVSLASDVGGGTSLSMQRTLADGYKVQALLARGSGSPLNAFSALYAATRGSARALQLDHEIGSLEPGRMADLCLWQWSVGAVDGHRMARARDLHEKVFAWMTLADDRHLQAAWIAGRQRVGRGQRETG
ncbi:MAG: guanine deaminase [Rubrivivax sp.]|nr:guanine deaminase [Rubrivivax sp.]MBK8525955.1 guanine deaminase [Rubrivivax sp.]